MVPIFCYVISKSVKGQKHAATGEDLARLRKMVACVLPTETDYTVVYARRELMIL